MSVLNKICQLTNYTEFATAGTLRFFQLFIILTVPLAKLRRRPIPSFLTNEHWLGSSRLGRQVCLQGRTKDKPTYPLPELSFYRLAPLV